MQNGIYIFIKLHNILRIFINKKNITIVMIGVSFFRGSTYMYYLWISVFSTFLSFIHFVYINSMHVFTICMLVTLNVKTIKK